MAQNQELRSWDNLCDTLLAAELGDLASLTGGSEVAVESDPGSSVPDLKCILHYEAFDCLTGEATASGASWIEISVHPWDDGNEAKLQYHAVADNFGGRSDLYDTHVASLSRPWVQGEVFVSQNLDRVARGAVAIALSEFYVIEASVKLEGSGCSPTKEDLAEILAEEYMPAVFDSIEARLAEA